MIQRAGRTSVYCMPPSPSFFLTHTHTHTVSLLVSSEISLFTVWQRRQMQRGITNLPRLILCEHPAHLMETSFTFTYLVVWLTIGAPLVCLFVGCFTSQRQASVSRGWICSDNFTCCHTEIQVAPLEILQPPSSTLCRSRFSIV